jgi:hypothetical protein
MFVSRYCYDDKIWRTRSEEHVVRTGEKRNACRILINTGTGMARPQVADGRDGIEIWRGRAAANVLNKQSRIRVSSDGGAVAGFCEHGT